LMHLGRHGDRARIEFAIPSRGLLGFRTEFLSLTRGTGLLNHVFAGYGAHKGQLPNRERGAMIAKEAGVVTSYALDQLSDRGIFFVEPGDRVYGGQIVGEHAKELDIVVQPCKKKHLTNMRSSTQDIEVRLSPRRELTIDSAIEWINDDELVEVAPGTIRLRKRILVHHKRKAAA
jgi:GTP-binding protein